MPKENKVHVPVELDFTYVNDKELKRVLNALARTGEVHVNTSSIDCDGVCGAYTNTYGTLEDYLHNKSGWIESLEGSASWNIVEKEDKLMPEDTGSFGHGWDIN